MLMRAWQASKGRPFVRVSRSLTSLPDHIKQRVHVDPMSSTYDPLAVEDGWQAFWERKLVDAKKANPDAPRFTMLLPPPNITGALHIGHALTVTIQDALARYHRMCGHEVLWIPGLDHAGIATQSVVEKQLWKEHKLTRHDVGRSAFLDHVHTWNATYGSRILNQLERLGALLNKDHTFFTLDDARCPTLQTAISDIEVDAVPLTKRTMLPLPGHATPVEFGVMHRFKYKVDRSDSIVADTEFVHVDTTRPETILGDVALAIHPDDARYLHLHGQHVVHPFTNERLPIVLDAQLVDPTLGTGVVKLTPAHDANDWACAQRHNLPHVVVMDKLAKMVTPNVPAFHGLDRFDARAAMVAKLQELDLYVEKLWWGHRIPAYRVHLAGHQASDDNDDNLENERWVVARNEVEARQLAVETYGDHPLLTLEQDQDVLDTWFSSALLPLSALVGNLDPKELVRAEKDLKREFPSGIPSCGTDALRLTLSTYLAQDFDISMVCVCVVWMPLRATANTSERLDAELSRLMKRLAKAEKTKASLDAKVADPLYKTRVPVEIQAQDAERIQDAAVEIATLTDSTTTLCTLKVQLTTKTT
ncbi:hypothetical protein DYB37_005362 [Aphanomyces astaci]|uniref:valine--tRNA ligase n=2 Tax=Aphanomyces astaci TaxID=112090 RepID=A0A3R7BC70_APHAT|nr:hypothetical protein DYB35_001359 [Aphanomyces astaci]RHZ04156.1 hypothetical protein DYB37_005362 [Aphanomyces astaci]